MKPSKTPLRDVVSIPEKTLNDDEFEVVEEVVEVPEGEVVFYGFDSVQEVEEVLVEEDDNKAIKRRPN